MGERESHKQVLQGSLGVLVGSRCILVEWGWLVGSKEGGWALEGVWCDCYERDCT
jgi:hypothetical protein